jgi:hypothetical protein
MANKKRSTRTKRRHQRGGLFEGWGDKLSSFGSSLSQNIQSTYSKSKNYLSGSSGDEQSQEQYVQPQEQMVQPQEQMVQPQEQMVQPQEQMVQPEMSQEQYMNQRYIQGGKRQSKSRRMKGGSKGLGLTYYATPVYGLNVAKPTYWEVYGDGHVMKAGTKRRKNHKQKHSRRYKKH